MKRILLVEDDKFLGQGLQDKLSTDYTVEWVLNLSDATKAIKNHAWDLVILDINLPDGNGLDWARQLEKVSTAPIKPPFIFLTAQGDAETRLQGYEAGADEFIPKPFHLRELLIRVKHVLQSHLSPSQEVKTKSATIRFSDLSIRYKDGRIDYPSSSDMKILKYLIEQSPRPVSRDDIINYVWGLDKDLSHRTIDNAMVRLRQALGPEGESLIRSVRGVGYQWLPEGMTYEE